MQVLPQKMPLSLVPHGATFQDGDPATARVMMVVYPSPLLTIGPNADPGAVAVVYLDTGEVYQLPAGLEVTVRAFTATPTTA